MRRQLVEQHLEFVAWFVAVKRDHVTAFDDESIEIVVHRPHVFVVLPETDREWLTR